MRPINVAVVSLALAVVLGTSARAQDEAAKRFSVQAGVSRLNDTNSRDWTSDTGFSAGLGYLFANPYLVKTMGARESVDIDFQRSSGNGNSVTTIGAAYTVRIPIGEDNGSSRPYYGIGLGVYRPEYKESFESNGSNLRSRSTSSDSWNKTNFGGKLLAGVDLANSIFVEASYIFSGKVTGVKTDTLNLSVGIKF